MAAKSGSSSSTRTAMRHKCGLLSMFKQAGAAAVEFAIVISLLVLITGGIIEFGRVMWYLDALTKATRDGARYMSIMAKESIGTAAAAAATDPPYNNTTNPVSAKSIVVNAAKAAGLPGFSGGNVLVTCQPSACTNGTAPDYVNVEIIGYTVAFGSWFAIPLPSGPWALTPHTTMRYMCDAGATTSC